MSILFQMCTCVGSNQSPTIIIEMTFSIFRWMRSVELVELVLDLCPPAWSNYYKYEDASRFQLSAISRNAYYLLKYINYIILGIQR